ncbi:MAG: hypothetical protein AAF299_13025, partial [Pseudomonadota bacterium]
LGMSNEFVDLMLFHGKHLGLFNFPVSVLRQRYSSADLQSSAWLPLYEIQRRGWDMSPAFNKIGTADDPGKHYDHLRQKDVEFYVTDQELFTVEAFDTWKLKQEYFDEYDDDDHQANDYLDYGDLDQNAWENYE